MNVLPYCAINTSFWSAVYYCLYIPSDYSKFICLFSIYDYNIPTRLRVVFHS